MLALCVVAGHSPGSKILGLTLFSGLTAVQCFYIISGFLITMVLNERSDYANLRNFYLSRYLRLWPAYVVVASLTLLLTRPHWLSQLSQVVHWRDVVFLAFSNLTLFFQDWTLFLRFDEGHLVPTAAFGTWPGSQVNHFLLVPQCWSLGVELTFYLIAPFACRRLFGVVALLAFGVASRLIVAALHPPALDPWVYRFAPSEMMLFAAGGLAYFGGRSIYPSRPRLAKLFGSVSVVFFIVVVLGNDVMEPWSTKLFGGFSQALLMVQWPFLLLTALLVAPLFYGSRSHPLDNFLGELSYPMYICHLLVLSLTLSWLPVGLQSGNLLYVVATIAAAIVLYAAVIKPADTFRHRLGARAPAARHPTAPRLQEATAVVHD